jgi:serine/threonine protein kinase
VLNLEYFSIKPNCSAYQLKRRNDALNAHKDYFYFCASAGEGVGPVVQKLEDTVIDHYYIMQLVARGGMAKIYKAEDTWTGKFVAIKVVHNNDENYYQRFRREVRAIADLHHEHILPALDWGEYGPWCYMVMPYIQHGTLTNRLLEGPFTPEEAGEILTQLADALHYAHERGIVHRDIKPSNVLMRDRNYAYLADFGLVKDSGTDHSLTQSGYLIGTPEYIAPEMLEGPATPTSDTYALGVLLYQMLTGRVPFTGTTPVEIIWKHVQERPVPPSRLNPAIPPAIDRVVLKALAKNPQRRFQSAPSLQQAYHVALTEKGEAWKHLDTSLQYRCSTPRPTFSKLLRPEALQTRLNALTQHCVTSAIELQKTLITSRKMLHAKAPHSTKEHPAPHTELSLTLLLVLSLCLLAAGLSSPRSVPATHPARLATSYQRELPMKISILLTLPPTQPPATTPLTSNLPPLKPSLMLKDPPANPQQIQNYNGYDNDLDDDNDNDTHGAHKDNEGRANHSRGYNHNHGRHGND